MSDDIRVVPMKAELGVIAEKIAVFPTFDNWVNKATSKIGGFPNSEVIICIDTAGYTCTCGKDMMYARDNDLFPVRAYRLIRNTEELLSINQDVRTS